MNLETERLRFRPMIAADEDYFFETWNVPQFRKYLWDDQAVERETVREIVEFSRESFAENEFGIWTLIEKESRRLIGFVGLRPAAFADGETELLYGVEVARWNQGFTAEASREIVRYAFADLDFEKIVAAANPENIASWRVLESIAMRQTGEKEQFNEPERTNCFASMK